MTIPPERERIDRPLNLTIPASLEKKIDEYAATERVKRSVAVRHILSSFFDGNFGKSKENNG